MTTHHKLTFHQCCNIRCTVFANDTSLHNRGYVFPRSIFVLLLANTAVFIAWQLPPLQPAMYRHFTCSWQAVRYEHRYYTLITSAFSHASFMHFAFNMLA